MACLPAPLRPPATPTSFKTANDNDDGVSNSNTTPAARDRDAIPGGGAFDASGAEEIVRTKETQSGDDEVLPRGDALGHDPSVAGSTPGEERRAVPVPVPRFQRAEDDGGSEGKEGSKNRAGFHSYDETHQVIESLWRGSNRIAGCVHVHAVRDVIFSVRCVMRGWICMPANVRRPLCLYYLLVPCPTCPPPMLE